MIFPCKLYMADNKNEIHNDKKLNSIPSHIVLIEYSLISSMPDEFIRRILKIREVIKFIIVNIRAIKRELFTIESMLFIFS